MGPRMGPWRTPVLTEYSCKDYWQKKEICILLRKEEIRPNIWPETPRDLSLCRGPAVEALAILSDTTVIRSVVDREDLKLYWKSEKDHISLGDQQSCYLQAFQDFTNYRKKSNRAVVFGSRPFPNIFKCRDHRWNLTTIWKTIRHLLKISANM